MEKSHVAGAEIRVQRTCGTYGRSETHLVHTVQELEEDGRKAATLAAGAQVAPLAELVAERQPFFLQKDLKTLKSPVERIAQQLHQGHNLPRGREKLAKEKPSIHKFNLNETNKQTPCSVRACCSHHR